MIKIGGAWLQTAKESKKQYISIKFAKELTKRGLTIYEDDNVMLLLNENKTGDNSPDYIAYLSNQKEKTQE